MKKKYHINLSKDQLEGAKFVILPGDPARVEKTAKYIDKNAKFLSQNREYTSFLAKTNNKGDSILVCSTGIGGPSMSIALEELASLGIENFYRIGTSGAIQEDIKIPSLIISSGAVRLDGASSHYAPIEYPAVADLKLTNSLVEAAEKLKLDYRYGITASSDSFYPGQERYDTHSGYVIKKFQNTLKEWQKLNVLNFEMEAATLFTIISSFGLKAACVTSAIVNRTSSEKPNDKILAEAEKNLVKVINEAVENHRL